MTGNVLSLLSQAQQLGFIGPGELHPHVQHAEGFVEALASAPRGLVVDLGSGGGLPALVVIAQTDREVLLVESQARRAEFLVEAVTALAATDRVRVAHERAETVALDHRGAAAAVTARSFGPPATTAECAAPFLAPGGHLIVSEPPGPFDPERWPADGLGQLGMRAGSRLERERGALQVLVQSTPPPDRFPRRVGVAAKRPLF